MEFVFESQENEHTTIWLKHIQTFNVRQFDSIVQHATIGLQNDVLEIYEIQHSTVLEETINQRYQLANDTWDNSNG